MLKRGYAIMGRLAYKAMTPFLRFYMTHKHHRVRVLLFNEKGEILLVRSWLGRQLWSMPGGGIQRDEAPLYAAVRELKEETGIAVKPHQLRVLGSFQNPFNSAPYTITCFTAKIAHEAPHQTKGRQLEVLDSKWMNVTHLPEDVSPTVKKALSLHH